MQNLLWFDDKINSDIDFFYTLENHEGQDFPPLFGFDEYFIRRKWDYFVKHLLKQEPPKECKLKGPSMEFLMKMLPL